MSGRAGGQGEGAFVGVSGGVGRGERSGRSWGGGAQQLGGWASYCWVEGGRAGMREAGQRGRPATEGSRSQQRSQQGGSAMGPTVRKGMPHCLQQRTTSRRLCTPAWWPRAAARPRCSAKRALPSIITCTRSKHRTRGGWASRLLQFWVCRFCPPDSAQTSKLVFLTPAPPAPPSGSAQRRRSERRGGDGGGARKPDTRACERHPPPRAGAAGAEGRQAAPQARNRAG